MPPQKLPKILKKTNLKPQQNNRHKKVWTEPNHELIFAAAWSQMQAYGMRTGRPPQAGLTSFWQPKIKRIPEP